MERTENKLKLRENEVQSNLETTQKLENSFRDNLEGEDYLINLDTLRLQTEALEDSGKILFKEKFEPAIERPYENNFDECMAAECDASSDD